MRKAKKNWSSMIAVIPALVLILAFCVSVNVQASEITSETVDLSEYMLQMGGLGGEENQALNELDSASEPQLMLMSVGDTIEDTIYEGLKSKQSTIDVSSYMLSSMEVSNKFHKVVNQHPELFYVTGGVSYNISGGCVDTISPTYNAEYTDEQIAAFNRKVEEIIAGVDSSWPKIEQILYIHDYMATHIEYDMEYGKYNAYNALVEGTCVCQGYSLAFVCLLNEIGVEVDLITSRNLNHAWNMVTLNGENFYVDVTWDDPLGGGETYCRHTDFMVDKNGLIATGHDTTDWYSKKTGENVYNTVATSSRYMDYFWKDMISAIPLVGTKAGYLSDGAVNIYDFNTGATKSYSRTQGRWYVWGENGWWTGDYCSMAACGDKFYFTTQKDIYSMDVNGNISKAYTLSDAEAGKGYIYGLAASGNNLNYILQTQPYGDTVYTGTLKIGSTGGGTSEGGTTGGGSSEGGTSGGGTSEGGTTEGGTTEGGTSGGGSTETDATVNGFVTRMYQQCLSRNPDQAGLDGWVGQLEGGYMDGSDIAEQFVFSQEMLSKNLSDTEFVKILYRSMMGREADAAGLDGWVGQLQGGYMTRSEVTKAFVESKEFTGICNNYGISTGTYDASIAPIEHFVTRFYTLCLERKPDQVGLYGWVGQLKGQHMNGAAIAEQFFFSNEFINRNLSNEKYIELLYNTLMGRPSDEAGKSGWLSQMEGGYMTRRDMMKAFIESKEFTEICTNYGITRGTVQ